MTAWQDVEGWLTPAQGARLAALAGEVPAGGQIVEIGSFRGKSAIAMALPARDGVSIVCIDPHAGSDRGPQEIAADAARGDADTEAFEANLRAAGVRDRVRHVRKFSDDAHGDVEGPIDLLYVDGAHRYGPARADIRDWGARVPPGGRMAVHDCFSSVGVTLALLRELTFSPDWRYLGRSRSLGVWERGRRGGVLRQLTSLPWFAWNVVLKVLILARLRRGPWPF